MARKTFISYKHSDAVDLRDTIIKKLKEDAKFYQGEDGFSDDMSSLAAETIKSKLKDMIWGTSVTIVIISPQMLKSKWIEWEISYALKVIERDRISSRTNGILGVVMDVDGYDWIISNTTKSDGCQSRYVDTEKLFELINLNRFNLSTNDKYTCEKCKTFDIDEGSYFSIIKEVDFLKNVNHYIEKAWSKSQQLSKYTIRKEV